MSNSDTMFSKIQEIDHNEELKAVDPKEFKKVLENRRSVRVYTSEPIPAEVVEEILEWGLLAPNSSNLQPWEFYWVKDPDKKAALVKACLSQPAASTAAELIVAVAKFNTWKKHANQMLEVFDKSEKKIPKAARDYYSKLAPMVYTQGPLSIIGFIRKIVLTAVGPFKVVPRQPTSRSDMRVWAVKTVALACENIMLGFSAHGYDTCPMEGFDSVRVKKILNLGSESEIVMVIGAGKRDKRGVYGQRIRMPKDQFIKII